MLHIQRAVFAVAATTMLVTSFGCPAREVSKLTPQPTSEVLQEIPIDINRDLDLLFVIDNSNSMREEQVSLSQNFPRFIEVLEGIEGGLPNVHIGVISTDMGVGPGNNVSLCNSPDNGNLLGPCSETPENPECAAIFSTPGDTRKCSGLGTTDNKPYLQDILDEESGDRVFNYENGSLVENFACRATQGIGGCGLEQPLAAMQAALEGNGNNDGFLRENAFLGIIFITDEDDCSAADTSLFTDIESGFVCFEEGVVCNPDNPTELGLKSECRPREDSALSASVSSYVEFVNGLKSDPGRIVVANISGTLVDNSVTVGLNDNEALEVSPSCQTNNGVAFPPVRLNAFTNSFRNNTITEICQENLEPALDEIARLIITKIGTRCVPDGIVSVNGIPQCTVNDVVNPDDEDRVGTPVSMCSSPANAVAEAPCWYFGADEEDQCTTELKQVLVVERNGVVPPVNSRIELRCELEIAEQ